MWPTLTLSLLLACGNKAAPQPETPPEPSAEEGDAAADADEATEGQDEADPDAEVDADSEKPTPESLYAECKDRVEGKQAEGECETDADCGTAGCGSEVCLPKSEVANVMTTCEDKLCFKVLDACGCNEGMCTWSLKDEVPELENAPKLPPNRLPPTPPPPQDDEQPEEGGDGAEEGAE